MAQNRHQLSQILNAIALVLAMAGAAQAEAVKATCVNLSMGTLVQASIWAPSVEEGERLRDVFDTELTRLATSFTVHDKGPLQTLNQSSGKWVGTPCEVVKLIRYSREVAQASGGAFDPTIGPLVNVWKIGFGGNRVPEVAEIAQAKKLVDYRRIKTEIVPGSCKAFLSKGQSLDLGAIAKGYIGTTLAKKLMSEGASKVMLNLGGNVALDGQATWRIGIQDPSAERDEFLAVVNIRNRASVITSGAYERKMTVNGKSYGHILNASTGYPVDTAWSSVTIVDEDGAKADAWCTAFFAMPKESVFEYIRRHPSMQVFLLEKENKVAWVSKVLAPHLEIYADGLSLRTIGDNSPSNLTIGRGFSLQGQ